jgi:hypothetical protein
VDVDVLDLKFGHSAIPGHAIRLPCPNDDHRSADAEASAGDITKGVIEVSRQSCCILKALGRVWQWHELATWCPPHQVPGSSAIPDDSAPRWATVA